MPPRLGPLTTRAFEVRKRAVAISWIGLRSSFLQIAMSYDVLAREAEAASGGVLAQQVEVAEPDASNKPRS